MTDKSGEVPMHYLQSHYIAVDGSLCPPLNKKKKVIVTFYLTIRT